MLSQAIYYDSAEKEKYIHKKNPKVFPNFAIMNISWFEIKPYENELPTNYADRIGRLYTDTVTAIFKKSNGQFFTPVSIAYFMGKQINTDKDSVSVLDPYYHVP